MSASSRRWASGAARALALIVAVGISAVAGVARADSIAVTDVQSDPALSREAGALTLLLRSHAARRSQRVSRADLAAAVTRIGPAGAGQLAVAAGKEGELASALDATVIATRLVSRGLELEATLSIATAGGEVSAQPPMTAKLGEIRELARQLVEQAGAATGQLPGRVKPVSIGELAIVARAGRRLVAGKPAEAAALIAGCPPGLGLKVDAVVEITRALADDAALELEQRLVASLIGGDLNAARALADSAKGPIAAAGLARVAVAAVNDPAARAELENARGSTEHFVVLARAARASEFGEAAEMPALYAPLLDDDPYLPALALATRFRPNLLGTSEAALIAAAAKVRNRHPELATALGVRALRSGRATREVFDLIDAYLLDASAIRDLSAALPSAAADDAGAARLVAEVGLRTGDVGTARTAYRKAAALAPEEPRLARTKGILEAAAAGDRDTAVDRAGDGAEQPAIDPARAQRLELLTDELAPVLSELPIAADGYDRLALVPLGGSKEPFYWPRRVHPERLADGLAAALATSEFRVKALVSPLETAEAPTAADMSTLASAQDAPAVLLYGIRADGGDAQIRLIYFNADSGAAVEVKHRVINAGEHGLVSINPIFVGGLAAIFGVFLVWLIYTLVRGSGMIRVELKVDPAANKPSFSILISRDKTCPAVSDPKKHLESVSVAERRRRFGADNVGANEEFERIPPGHWFVHVFGTYGKGGQLRALPPLTEPARVRRNQITTVVVDLVPKESEFHFLVMAPTGPTPGARLWLASNPAHKVVTDEEGKAILFATTGEHTVHVDHGDIAFTRKIHAYGSRISTVTINLERERRLAQIAGGLAVELEPDEGADIIPDRREAMRSAPAAAEADRPDTLRGLRRYQPEAELGRGAMGVVYRATDQVLGRKVALKVMSPEIREHPTAAQMFEQEAKALAALNHPNVVTVFDQGRDGEQMFMVMEFVEGSTLEDVLEERTRLDLAEAARIGEQLGRGLAYAHGRRVIHRDIKPANIFLSDDGTVKLGDFGLARVIHEVSIRRTEVKGTPLYMAPEQIRGANIDFRADIYSVGCTLFEILSGRPPFVEGEILYHHLNTEPPRLSSLVGVPEVVDTLVMKCIAKDARERPASADRIADVFGKLRRG